MRILIAGAGNALAKLFIKQNKKKHEMIALDEKSADFSDYLPVREIFKAYKFDAVIYFTAAGTLGKAKSPAGNVNLLKNLSYAAALNGVPVMVTADADESIFFNALAAGVAEKDKTVTVLRFYGLIGKGLSPKTNFMMKLLSEANKSGLVELARDRRISLAHTDDALGAVTAFLERGLSGGCFDIVPSKPTTLSAVSRAAKKILGGETEIRLLTKERAPDYAGNPESLKAALPRFKFLTQNTAIEKVLGNV